MRTTSEVIAKHGPKLLARLGCLLAAASVLAPARAQAQLAAGEAATLLTQSDWATGLSEVTDLTFMSDGRAVFTLKGGEVVVASADGQMLKRMAATFMVNVASEMGLLGVVRDDADNLYFYASSGPDVANRHEVWRAKLGADGTVAVEAKPLVSGGLEGPANHDGGGLVIYKGQLYVSVGDTGFNSTPPQNKYGACLNRPNGKILRLNLDGSTPADNPLSSLAMATGCANVTAGNYALLPPDRRIWAWGFRNPWRFWIDAETDLMWVGDVGEGTEEEITVGGKGSNHGWPFNEGKVKYAMPLGGLSDCQQMTPASDCLPPQDSYQHNGQAASVTGGLVPPKGCGWGGFEQRYIFGDYNLNVVWTLNLTADRKGAVPGSRTKIADVNSPVSFRMGPRGALYVVAHEVGKIVKIVPQSVPAGCGVTASPVADAGAGGGAGGGGAAAGGAGGTAVGGGGGAAAGGGGGAVAGGGGNGAGGGGAGARTGSGGAGSGGGAGKGGSDAGAGGPTGGGSSSCTVGAGGLGAAQNHRDSATTLLATALTFALALRRRRTRLKKSPQLVDSRPLFP